MIYTAMILNTIFTLSFHYSNNGSVILNLHYIVLVSLVHVNGFKDIYTNTYIHMYVYIDSI